MGQTNSWLGLVGSASVGASGEGNGGETTWRSHPFFTHIHHFQLYPDLLETIFKKLHFGCKNHIISVNLLPKTKMSFQMYLVSSGQHKVVFVQI